MAWIFSLSAECGSLKTNAQGLAHHFAAWPSGVFQDRDSNWWFSASPDGLSRTGVGSAADAAAMTVAGHQLYDQLRTAPPVYRYALAGVETDEFRIYHELLAEKDLTIFPGLVLSESIWSTGGQPAAFVPFAPGYRWIPYAGEHHDAS